MPAINEFLFPDESARARSSAVAREVSLLPVSDDSNVRVAASLADGSVGKIAVAELAAAGP